jgi:cysteine desulfurase
MFSPVYLDHNATTPCDPRVVEAMLPYFQRVFGNPANGLHRQGRQAARAVDQTREQVGALLNAQPHEIVFTAGATESNNLAILGLARRVGDERRNRIITNSVEHKAVLVPCEKLAEQGFDVIYLPVDRNGRVDIGAADAVIDDRTLLVSIQAANNEVGTLQPVEAVAEMAHAAGAFVHCDAAQAVGKIPVDVEKWGVDLLSLSAHKFYGPKGIGALYLRGGAGKIALEPLVYGGGQEHGLRSGTTNVPAIIGLGEASRLCAEHLSEEMARIRGLRDALENTLTEKIPNLYINSAGADRLPNTSSLSFPGVDADALLLNLPDVMMGTGSACTSGAIEPSHVLQAMGLTRADAFSTVRASLGRFTNADEVRLAADAIIDAWNRLNRSA